MNRLRLAGIGAGLGVVLATGGCTYGDYGGGYDSGGYGQGGYDAPVPQAGGYDRGGYAGGGYDQGYYDDGGYAADGSYGSSPAYGGGYDGFADGPDYGYGYGWYDDFYYPGFGLFIYDRGGHRHPWRSRDRDYWSHHPRPHQDRPPHPGESGWRGPSIPGRGAGRVAPAGPAYPNAAESRGRWRGQDGAPDRGAGQSDVVPQARGPAYMRRPMPLEQRDRFQQQRQQSQNAPDQPMARGSGRYWQNRTPQGVAPVAPAPQGRVAGGASNAPPPQPQASAPGQWHGRNGAEMRAPAMPARGGHPPRDDSDSGHHHHHDD